MTWTSSDVTKYMDEYFEARPQFNPPSKGMLGYDVPLPLAAVLHSMAMEIKKLKTPQRRPVKLIWAVCGREGAEEVSMKPKDGQWTDWMPLQKCTFPTRHEFKFRKKKV